MPTEGEIPRSTGLEQFYGAAFARGQPFLLPARGTMPWTKPHESLVEGLDLHIIENPWSMSSWLCRC